jgi:hypothetical protein
MREYSADEILAFYNGGPVPVSWHRRSNAGQLCAKCKRIVGHRAITDGVSVWHPECDKSFSSLASLNSSSQSASLTRENRIQLGQPQSSSVGGDSTSVASKMNRGGESLRKFERSRKLAEKRQAKQAKHSRKSASASRRSPGGRRGSCVPLRLHVRLGNDVSTVSQWRDRAREIIERVAGHLSRDVRVRLVRQQQEWVESQIEKAWRTKDRELGDTCLDVFEVRLRSAVERLVKERTENHA